MEGEVDFKGKLAIRKRDCWNWTQHDEEKLLEKLESSLSWFFESESSSPHSELFDFNVSSEDAIFKPYFVL